MNEADVSGKIAKQLAHMAEEKNVFLFVVSPENYGLVCTLIADYLTRELRLEGIYITLNTGYSKATDTMKKKGIDTAKLFFVDAVSKSTGKTIKSDNCSLVEGPQSLTELSMAIATTAASGKYSFLVMDSINVLLLYNDLKTTEKFSHYLISRMRSINMGAIILSVQDETVDKMISTVSQFCDGIVRL
jgi:KaiC/GvpD/RAD55 family RecA-like ATPase